MTDTGGERGERRTLALLAIGAALGVGIAGAGLIAGRGADDLPASAVAMVNGTAI